MASERGLLSQYQDPAILAKALLVAGPVYPLWHFLGPAGAVDPWAPWWVVGAALTLIHPASGAFVFVRRNLLGFCTAGLSLVTLHFFVLAHLNQMQTFYAVGSVMAVLTCPLAFATKRAFLSYAAFVTCLAGGLLALQPDALKIAFWAPAAIVMSFYYNRLTLQLRAARLADEHRAELEAQVEARTRDLSERTRELSDANEQLRRGIEERALLEEQLRISQRMEAVGRLAGGIAHDFNNLLTAIRGYTELLLDALSDPRLRDDVEQIQKATEQAGALTHQLLTFGRGQMLKTTVLELDEIVSGMAMILRTVLGPESELVTSTRASRCLIRANRTQLEQVILNLALNARDAMPSGGKLSLETSDVRREDLDEELFALLTRPRYVLLAATDTGVGMDARTRTRVFEPFFTTKDVGHGTGLGLSTVYGVVQRSGGHVRVLSEPGRGARFELYWPHHEDVEEEGVPDPRLDLAFGSNECVLVVEDEPMVRTLSARFLRSIGYRVIETPDAEAALAVASDPGQEIDLVVSDVVMPRMSGLELAERLEEIRPGLPILYVSGNLDHPSLRSIEAPPEARILRKPFTREQLAASVREALDGETG